MPRILPVLAFVVGLVMAPLSHAVDVADTVHGSSPSGNAKRSNDAPGVVVPPLTDLRADLAEAGQRNIPILILFHTHGCGYCHYVMEDHLRPMVLSGDYVDRALLRQLNVGDNDVLVDQNGQEVEAGDFARSMTVRFFPTVLILGPDSRVLAEPLIGVANIDLYGTQLEYALQEAEARLRKPE